MYTCFLYFGLEWCPEWYHTYPLPKKYKITSIFKQKKTTYKPRVHGTKIIDTPRSPRQGGEGWRGFY